MRFAIDKLRSSEAQGTLEAAIIIPILFTLVLLLVQPAIVLYDKIIMKSAAAEACRIANSAGNMTEGDVEDFIRRRLSAIPEVDCFHIHSGGCSYTIRIEGTNGTYSGVMIYYKVKPLPLIDVALKGLNATSYDGNLVLSASYAQIYKPECSWE